MESTPNVAESYTTKVTNFVKTNKIVIGIVLVILIAFYIMKYGYTLPFGNSKNANVVSNKRLDAPPAISAGDDEIPNFSTDDLPQIKKK